MKLVVVFLTIFLTSVLANDSFERVLITKTSKKSNLPMIKRTLDRLNVKMYVQSIPSGYYVYTKKFDDKRVARYNLRKIKRVFPYAKIVQIGGAKTAQKSSKKSSITEGKYFARFGLANSSIGGSTNVAGASNLDNASMGFALEAGYVYSPNLFFTGAFMDNSTDDISLTNLYATANYNYELMEGLGVYAGGMLGFSTLELSGFALTTPSTSLMYGIQFGATYSLLDYLSFFANYQMFMLDHSISMEDDGSIVKFDSLNNFMLGVGYEF
jgi:hypothetical protein